MKKYLTRIYTIIILTVCLFGLLPLQKSYAVYNPFPTSQTLEYNGRMYTTIPCTWYAWQQAYDRLGIELPMRGNATDWNDEAINQGYPTGTTPRANSIAVWEKTSDNPFGHVAYVTGVNGNSITYNEGGSADKRANSQGIYEGHTLPDGYTEYPQTYIYLDGYSEYYIDLNWKVDGTEVWYSDVPGTVDVYINGSLVKSNADDYYEKWPNGTTYEFKNRKDKSGYEYSSVTGNTKGTLSSGNVATYFNYKKKKAPVSSDWVQSGTGTWTYWDIPSGFDKNHALYSKYNNKKLESSETTTKKTVAEAPVCIGWIYYHWTSNMYARANNNYNVFINECYAWEGSREYYNFRAFESTNDHGHTDKNGIYGGDDVYYSWGDNPEDGSWWWFRVPLYSQKWTSYTKKTAQTIEVSGISLNKTSLSLVTGGTETLSATVTPSNATNKTITWSSSNTSVATVSNGKVTAVGAGTATITAKAGSKSATCSITIKNPVVEVSGISLNSVSISLVPGETETLTATVTPSNATNKTVTWSSSNTKVATISNGKVTAVAVGTATITAKSGSKSVTCSVTVYNPTVEVLSVALNKTSLSMVSGDTESLSATITPANATNKTITWSSSNSAVATVDAKGKITAVAAGTATITAKAENKSAMCYVTVSDPTVYVTSIVLSNSELSLTVGDSEYLYATVYPSNASDKDVTWWSSDFSVAGVEDGYITAYSAGTAVITAQAGSKIGYCTVTVRDDNNVEIEIDLEDKKEEDSLVTIGGDPEEDLYEEDEQELEPEIEPEPVGTVLTSGNINFTVSDYGEVSVKSVKGSPTKIVIPAEITYNGFDYDVIAIQKNAFKKNSKITSVTIEADLDYIGESAFESCKALTTLSIKGDVLKICKKAFYNCKKLKTISILTDSLEKVESKAFSRIDKNASIKTFSSMVTAYKALLKKGGFTAQKVNVSK